MRQFPSYILLFIGRRCQDNQSYAMLLSHLPARTERVKLYYLDQNSQLPWNLVFSNAVFRSSEGHGRLNRHVNFFVSFNVKLRLFVYKSLVFSGLIQIASSHALLASAVFTFSSHQQHTWVRCPSLSDYDEQPSLEINNRNILGENYLIDIS